MSVSARPTSPIMPATPVTAVLLGGDAKPDEEHGDAGKTRGTTGSTTRRLNRSSGIGESMRSSTRRRGWPGRPAVNSHSS
jgi:hypothetical protein